MPDDDLESLTPYSDALRDLTNLSASFEVFTKIKPILERVATIESAIPSAKATLDRIAATIDLAQAELDTVNGKIDTAQATYAHTVATLTQRATDEAAKVSAASRKAREAFAIHEQEMAEMLAATQTAHAARVADMEAEERTQRGRLEALAGQIAAAENQLGVFREMVGRG